MIKAVGEFKEPKWVTDYNNQQELQRLARKSLGYRGRILSRYEGLLETIVDEIRRAPTSLHAVSILSQYMSKFYENKKKL